MKLTNHGKGNTMPHSDVQLSVFAPAITFLSMSKGKIHRWELRSFCAIKMVADLCFEAFPRNVVDGNVSGKGCLLIPGGNTRTMYQCQKPEVNSDPLGAGEEGRSLFSITCINHPIYPQGTIFQSAFRMEWFMTMLSLGPDMPISANN